MKSTLLSISIVLTLASAGCAGNPYKKFYNGFAAQDLPMLIPHEGEPVLYTTYHHERDGRTLVENGYTLLGVAGFNADRVDSSNAIRQGKVVGAAIVLLQSEYTHTLSGTIPFSTPSQTYHQGTVSGSGGWATYSGTSTGYTTHHIPYTVHRHDYLASFWAKSKPSPLGVLVIDLTPDLRRELGTNRGVVVSIVVKDSPAFNADIVPGDVILRINNETIGGGETFVAAIRRFAGEDVVIHAYRDGKEREVSLRLNRLPE